MPVSPARAAAFEILLRIETTDAYASELLHSPRVAKLSPADHALLTELVMGVLRWRSVLDLQIAEHLAQPLDKLDREVLTALRLAAYQIQFLDRIPKHAAVDESVDLVKRARKRSAAGMVNAVLRKSQRASTPAEARLAHPEWLTQRWTRTYGADVAPKICEYNQSAPALAIRINDRSQLGALGRDRIHLEQGKLLRKSYVIKSGDVTKSAVFRERRLIIQDEASQLVALLVGEGKNILDCCAAPGGKTRIMAQRNPQSTVVAMELHPHRARLLGRLVSEKNVRVVAADARQMPFSRQFDRILVDAPCSGTGTLARNPEIKWRLKPQDLLRMQEYQVQILRSAMKHVASGGRIIYSTCSLEPEENEQVVEKALAEHSEFALIDCRSEVEALKGELAWKEMNTLVRGPLLRTIPGVHPWDGFFAAILERQ